MRLSINHGHGLIWRLNLGRKIHVHMATLASLLLITAVACGEADAGSDAGAGSEDLSAGASNSSPQMRVITTLYPIEYFTKRVGGIRVDVSNLVSAGVEAHHFEPTAGDLRKVQEADLLIYAGAGFEPWVDRTLAALGDSAPDPFSVVDEVGSGVEGGKGVDYGNGPGGDDDQPEEEPADPHVWLDPLTAVDVVRVIQDAISSVDHPGEEVYAANAADLETELRELHEAFSSGLTNCSFDAFVTSHAAYGYLGDRYDLREVSLTGTSPEAEPKPGSLAGITEEMRELGLRHVFVEPILDPRTVESLAREVGAEVLLLHPLESLTPEQAERGETYFSLMRQNLDALRRGLDCRD